MKQATQYVEYDKRHQIAYYHEPARAKQQTVLFLPGYASTMYGDKAIKIAQWAQQHNLGFAAMDYLGQGESSGDMTDLTLSKMLASAKQVLSELNSDNVIVVGSSIGAWVGLWLAQHCQASVKQLIGIASAIDFSELVWGQLPDGVKSVLQNGQSFEFTLDDSGETFMLHHALFEDAKQYLLLQQPLQYKMPITLLHSTDDGKIPWQQAAQFIEHVDCEQAKLILVKSAGHRFHTEESFAHVKRALDNIL